MEDRDGSPAPDVAPVVEPCASAVDCAVECRSGSDDACLRAGEMFAREERTVEEVEVYWVACDRRSTVACSHGAELGSRMPGDPRVIAMLRNACTAGDAAACLASGDLLVPSPADDSRPAAELSGPSVHFDDVYFGGAAVVSGLDGALASRTLSSSEREQLSAARDFYRRACELEALEGCARLGRLLRAGLTGTGPVGDEQVLAEAAAVTRRACEAGVAEGCLESGRVLLQLDRAAEAETAFTEGCDAGDGESCRTLGARLEGAGNAEDARRFYGLACAAELPAGCFDLAVTLHRAGEFPDALTAYSKACGAGLWLACTAYNIAMADAGDPGQASLLQELSWMTELVDGGPPAGWELQVAGLYLRLERPAEAAKTRFPGCWEGQTYACCSAAQYLANEGWEDEARSLQRRARRSGDWCTIEGPSAPAEASDAAPPGD